MPALSALLFFIIERSACIVRISIDVRIGIDAKNPVIFRLHQLNYQKTKVCVVNLLPTIFGDQRIKGFRQKGE